MRTGKGTPPGPELYPECGTAMGTQRHRKDQTQSCARCRAYDTARSAVYVKNRMLYGPLKTSARGSLRRVRALMFLGWPLPVLEQRWGLPGNTLSQLSSRREVTKQRAELIARGYRELAFAGPGPDERTRMWARRRGWPGPMDWDDIDRQDDVVPGYVVERDHAEALKIHREVKKMLAKREKRGRQRRSVDTAAA